MSRRMIPLLCSLLLLCSCATTPPPPVVDVFEVPYLVKAPPGQGPDALWEHLPRQVSDAVLAFGGDLLLHGRVRDSAAAHDEPDGSGGSANHAGFDFLFEHLGPVWRDADVTLLNLETPVAPQSGAPGRSFVFNVSPALLDALAASGVDRVTLANNHAFDQGAAGLQETLEHLKTAGLRTVGAGATREQAGELSIETVGDLRIGFLGYSQLLNDDLNVDDPQAPHINVLEQEQVVAAIAAARPHVDFLVLTAHWGVEYAETVREQEVDLAHALLEAGADAIIGHHPHVLQPLELYRTADGRLCPIAYSLGNLISNQSRKYRHGITPAQYGATRDGAILKLRVARMDYGAGLERVELRGVGYVPLYTENNFLAQQGDSTLATVIQTVPSDLRISQLLGRIRRLEGDLETSGRTSPLAQAQNWTRITMLRDALIRAKQELALYADRKSALINLLGDEFYLPYRAPEIEDE